jgi:hypothetical protein
MLNTALGLGLAPATGGLSYLLPLLDLGSGLLGGLFSSGEKDKDRELQQQELDQNSANALRNTAVTEGSEDPFRQQLDQAQALQRLDLLGHSAYTPVQYGGSSVFGGTGQTTGGFSYDRDPAMSGYLDALKASVARGETAPSMTDASNYGKTATLDLTQPSTGLVPSYAQTTSSLNDLGTPPTRTGKLASASAFGTPQPAATPYSNGTPRRPNDPLFGAPEAPELPTAKGTFTTIARRSAISAWEKAHPGWTVDPTTGQVARAA